MVKYRTGNLEQSTVNEIDSVQNLDKCSARNISNEVKEEIRESKIEAALVKGIKSLGGLCEKFTSPARRSCPDRLVSLPGGAIIFVECKRPGGKCTKGQLHDHEVRRKLGNSIFVIDSLDAVRQFVYQCSKFVSDERIRKTMNKVTEFKMPELK